MYISGYLHTYFCISWSTSKLNLLPSFFLWFLCVVPLWTLFIDCNYKYWPISACHRWPCWHAAQTDQDSFRSRCWCLEWFEFPLENGFQLEWNFIWHLVSFWRVRGRWGWGAGGPGPISAFNLLGVRVSFSQDEEHKCNWRTASAACQSSDVWWMQPPPPPHKHSPGSILRPSFTLLFALPIAGVVSFIVFN